MFHFGPPDVEKCKARRDVKGLVEALRYPLSSEVRASAARALGILHDGRALPALVKALEDHDAKVRQAAQAALVQMGQRPEQPEITLPAVSPEQFVEVYRNVYSSEKDLAKDQVSPKTIAPELLAPRVVRVFISSTFRDMQAERDELVKHVFPELRARCRERDVDFVEVDLRWGVTEEQAERGEVLQTCLAEIDACRPYFIGLLGERYGWVPDHIESEILEEHAWMKENQDRSMTELEIMHAILDKPEKVKLAFFYFRNSTYLMQIPSEEKTNYLAENAILGGKLGRLKGEICEKALPLIKFPISPKDFDTLKKEIRKKCAQSFGGSLPQVKPTLLEEEKNKYPVFLNYPDPLTLGQRILDDLWTAIDAQFPQEPDLDPLDRAAREHTAFGWSRTRVFINRPQYDEILQRHARGDGPPLVLLGESGIGKTALLTHWAQKYRKANPDQLVLVHYIGSTPQSADWKAMLQRIMGELQRRFHIAGDIPDEPDALKADFTAWLSKAAGQGRVVLVLDGLDHLEDRDDALDLGWLPVSIPAGIRLALSTLPGHAKAELQRRGWTALTIQPLTINERLEFIKVYLEYFRKALNEERSRRIAESLQVQYPLYLRALLEELRVFGNHEQLDLRINYYLAAGGLTDLYGKILERYEQDYERDHPGLVREAMSLLWAARRGLAESELRDLLGDENQPIAPAIWSPLYLAAYEGLANHAGLLTFFDDSLRTAVRDRYLPDEAARQAVHLRLADYFSTYADDQRQVDELPWQLAQAGAWQRLYDVLVDLKFFRAIHKANVFDLKDYWAKVQANSPLRIVEGYRPVFDQAQQQDPGLMKLLGDLLSDMGNPKEALGVRKALVEEANRPEGDGGRLRRALLDQASSLKATGDLDGALALLKDVENASRELGDHLCLGAALNLKGLIFQSRNQLDEALAAFEENGRLYAALKDKAGLSASFGNQGIIHQIKGDLDGALALHQEEVRLSREMGDLDGLEAAIGNQGLLLLAKGSLDEAMALLKEQEDLDRKLGKKAGLHISLGNQAIILRRQGNPAGAMALNREKEKLCRELDDREGLTIALLNIARILILDLKRPKEAVGAAKEAYQLARQGGYAQLADQAIQIIMELQRLGVNLKGG